MAQAKVVAILSQKGGTGKTTATKTLADTFTRCGLRILTVDLDPQGNLSDYFDVAPDASPTISELLTGACDVREAIHNSVIPANLTLAEAELTLAGKMGRELTLKRALRSLKDDYDLILLDCPPTLGLLTVNALVAAQYALLSAEAQYFALQGIEQARQVIDLAQDSLNPDLKWLGVMFTIADMRTVHSREAAQTLREELGDLVFTNVIRQSIAYAESAERGVSILDYRPDLGVDYLQLAEEILTRLGVRRGRQVLKRLIDEQQSLELIK